MPFISLEFLVFFVLFFTGYWLLAKQHSWQNRWLLFGSYFFYAWFNWWCLLLLVLSSLINYQSGLAIFHASTEKKQKWFLRIGIGISVGTLLYFKYTNFFLDTLSDLSGFFHIGFNKPYFNILLPVGISFYTFRTISYLLDIYYGKIRTVPSRMDFFNYVAFFPELMAGPIDRATALVPQISSSKKVNGDKMIEGFGQIILGCFKKLVVADNIATIVDLIYDEKSIHLSSSLSILIAVIAYVFQMYCDFSGYTDIATGIGKLMGFDLKINFNRPLFSRNITEFWKRWHISLSSWLNDYVYTPIAINKRNWNIWGNIYALFITFLISGLWHGAGWTFIVWGLLHAVALSYEYLTKTARHTLALKMPHSIYNGISVLLTFSFIAFVLIFFRADSIEDAWIVLSRLTAFDSFTIKNQLIHARIFYIILVLIFLDAFCFEFFKKNNKRSFAIILFLIIHILLFGAFSNGGFIYFKF